MAKPTTKDRKAVVEALAPAFDKAGYKRGFAVGRLTYGSFVSMTNRYLFVETPKAACTSLKQLVASLEGVTVDTSLPSTQRETRLDMLIHQRDRLDIPTLLDVAPELARDLLQGKAGWFVFSFVRNPYSRLVSAFENKIRQSEIPYRRYGGRWLDAGRFGGIRGAFADFIAVALDSEHLDQTDNHFRQQASLILNGAISYTRIFKMEEMAEFVDAFATHLQQLGIERNFVVPRVNASLPIQWRSYYTETSAQKVFGIYQSDFETFGYNENSWEWKTEPPNEDDFAIGLRKEIAARNEMIEYLYDRLDYVQEFERR